MGKITPVLLSGGTGSRLWPLSRQSYPKQLLSLIEDETLLQQTARRVADKALFSELIVVANADHRFVIAEQLRAIGMERSQIVLEPVGRNTAPAAAVAALLATRNDPEAILLLMPADHSIGNVDAFHLALQTGCKAARNDSFVLFGIKPTTPATGYGYIHVGGPALENFDIRQVLGFVEKPDLATAESYLKSGDYAWNSGIFMLPAQRFLDELNRLEPDMLKACKKAIAAARTDLDFLRLDADAFAQARDISIDYAIMERTENAVVVPSSFPWSDIGTWSALWEMESKNDEGSVVLGEAVAIGAKDCYIRSEGPLVAALGVENLVIVATPDAVLVTTKEHDQDVKLLVDRLKATGHEAATQTMRVHRPWGFYQQVHYGERFQVKRITVKPGAKLSLQKHFHRAEHWIVVNGTALVTRDNEQILLRENESAYLPLGCVHRLENPGHLPLNLIEVQSGAYLGEDDIVRFEDVYARV
ncbi:mannose-1-phosphate guanylyltransferase/mannose-6-phosphate isomerase [Microvirga sp. 2TAF3]|uniref:mannose-1-phosphate guanylyltransferase/mannose-6-phosphate isomerase n=1 Tax=Microvirga sp. 2TAF3 TaxID=3233014 RepID=UPI003F94DC49